MMSKITITITPVCHNLYGLANEKPRVIEFGRRYNFAVVAPAYCRVPTTRHVGMNGVVRQIRSRALLYVDGAKVINREGQIGVLVNGDTILFDKAPDPRIRVSVHATA